MLSRFKISLLFVATIIVILTVLAGLTFAADTRFKLAAALTNLSAYIHAGQYRSYIKDIALVAYLFSLVFCRVFFFISRQQN